MAKSKEPSEIKDIGRPTKFTPERRALIVDAIAHRIPYEYAAEANGICEETLYEWLRIAKAHAKEGICSDYTKFSEDIKKAEMQRIREHLDMIAAKPERWQADSWILERRWWRHFSTNAHLNELNTKLENLNSTGGEQSDNYQDEKRVQKDSED